MCVSAVTLPLNERISAAVFTACFYAFMGLMTLMVVAMSIVIFTD